MNLNSDWTFEDEGGRHPMPPEGLKRRLTAILSADAAGYSRLMREDDDATVRTLTGYRETMTALIKEHRGSFLLGIQAEVFSGR